MKRRILSSLKAIAILLIVGYCGLALDSLLPTEEMDTHVHHLLETTDSVVYVVPGSGGELATCSIADKEFRQLQPNTEIVVLRTLILSRCVGVSQLRCQGLVCSSGSKDAINTDTFVRNAIHYAYGDRYSTVGELAKNYPGYSPQVRRWPDVRGSWGSVRYSVRMPEQLVIVDKDGNAVTSRKCGSDEGLCQRVPRKGPL